MHAGVRIESQQRSMQFSLLLIMTTRAEIYSCNGIWLLKYTTLMKPYTIWSYYITYWNYMRYVKLTNFYPERLCLYSLRGTGSSCKWFLDSFCFSTYFCDHELVTHLTTAPKNCSNKKQRKSFYCQKRILIDQYLITLNGWLTIL